MPPPYLPITLNGVDYLCDPIKRQTLPAIREQADQSREPGENSLNPRGLWRRSQESWHHGAGQTFLDSLDDTDRYRFRASKGVDCWTRGQLSLLNQTLVRRKSINTNLALLSVASYLYVADGTEVYWTSGLFNQLLTDNQASLETDTTGWVGGANTTIARSTAQAHDGTASLSLTAVGAGDMSASTLTGTSGVRVTPLVRYQAQILVRAATTARTIEIYFDWYNAAGGLISSSLLSSAPDSTAGWGSFANLVLVTAPALATTAAIRVAILAAGAAEVHYVDTVAILNGSLSTVRDTASGAAIWTATNINAGEAAQSVQSITSDGNNVWAALGTSGIHRTIRGATTSTANVPGPGAGWITLVGYVNGRLLAAGSHTSTTARNVLFEVVNPLSAPALGDGVTGMRFIHPNTDFIWTFIAFGRNCIYAGGNSGANAEIYRITIESVSTTLAVPIFASYLPDGETIHALQFYAGGVIMGTSRGVRLAVPDSQGNLDYGPLIPMVQPVRALEPQDRFCWFSWSNLDFSSTGLGRLDLGQFTEALVPAYAPDLMATPVPPAVVAQGEVLSIVTVTPTNLGFPMSRKPAYRAFAVSGLGVFIEDVAIYRGASTSLDTLVDGIAVASGYLETGTIRYSTSARKTARALELRHHALEGTVAVDSRYDDIGYAAVGLSSTPGSNGPSSPLGINQNGESFELQFTLTRPTQGRLVTGSMSAGSSVLTLSSGTVSAADVGRAIDHYGVNGFNRQPRIVAITSSTIAVLSDPSVIVLHDPATFAIGGPLRAPELVRYTLKALPTPGRNEVFSLPIILRPRIEDLHGGVVFQEVDTLFTNLKALESAGTVVPLAIGSDTYEVFVDQIQFEGETLWREEAGDYYYVGTAVVLAQTVEA